MSLVILFTGYVVIDRYTFQTKRNVIDDKALENTHIIIAHTHPVGLKYELNENTNTNEHSSIIF